MKVQEGERGSLRALEWERAGGLALSELALGCFFFLLGGGAEEGGGLGGWRRVGGPMRMGCVCTA